MSFRVGEAATSRNKMPAMIMAEPNSHQGIIQLPDVAAEDHQAHHAGDVLTQIAAADSSFKARRLDADFV